MIPIIFAGHEHALSSHALDNLIAEVCSPVLNEGLLSANEKLYNHLLYGLSITEFVDGKKANPTIALIDWHNPANNHFCFTEEFSITRAGGVDTRRPDIVCFVNGIPLVVIEAKRPNGYAKKAPTIDEGMTKAFRKAYAINAPTKSHTCLPTANYFPLLGRVMLKIERILVDILPALKDEDSSCETAMPSRENVAGVSLTR